MAINFKISLLNDVLIITAEGFDEGLEEAKNYSREVTNYAVKHSCKKVVCDERNLEYRLTMVETYKLAEFVADSVPYSARVAIVADKKFKDVIEFWETVSVNRGVLVKAFHEYDEALNWVNA